MQSDQFLSILPQELHNEVTDILMSDEKESLHNWDAKKVMVKQKNDTVAQNVTETILTFRWYLVNSLIEELKKQLATPHDIDSLEVLTSVRDYNELIKIFSNKLGRVMSRF